MYARLGLVPLARNGWRSFQPCELRQVCALSTLSKAITITRFGASPSSAVTFPPRTRNFPPNACIVAGLRRKLIEGRLVDDLGVCDDTAGRLGPAWKALNRRNTESGSCNH